MATKPLSKRQKHFRRTRWLLKITLLLALLAILYRPVARTMGVVAVWTSDLLDDYHYKHIDSFGIHIPTRYEIHGIDVSRYQGRIDWEKVAAMRSEENTSELQVTNAHLVCRLLLEKKTKNT